MSAYVGRHRGQNNLRNFDNHYDQCGARVGDEGRTLYLGFGGTQTLMAAMTLEGDAVTSIRKALATTVDIDQLADLCDDYSKTVSHLITRQAVNRRTKTGDTTAEENAVYVAETDIRNYLAGGKP